MQFVEGPERQSPTFLFPLAARKDCASWPEGQVVWKRGRNQYRQVLHECQDQYRPVGVSVPNPSFPQESHDARIRDLGRGKTSLPKAMERPGDDSDRRCILAYLLKCIIAWLNMS